MEKIQNLQEELDNVRKKLQEVTGQNDSLKRAIWDVFNYANLFLLITDSLHVVRLANWSLSTKLGFEDEKGLIDKCWLDFFKPEDREMISNIYKLIIEDPQKEKEYREIVTEIFLPNEQNKSILVNWFNVKINHNYNLILSIGIQKSSPMDETIESVRAYYRDIVKKDKTMIEALKAISFQNSFISSC